jgi:hypothetical protein
LRYAFKGLLATPNIGRSTADAVKGDKAGMSVDTLASLTDLTPEQVIAILKENKIV